MKMSLKRTLCELGFLVGLCVLVYGLWLAWRPLGFIVGGLVLALVAFFVHYDMRSAQEPAEASGKARAN